MTSISSSSSSYLSSISTSSKTKLEVFLSFSCSDTCKGFADCLYNGLIDAGINVFRDDNSLHPGEKIRDALLESVKQSKISIPIISSDYASSPSCLMELAQMLECEKANTQLIMPIFYDINSSDLKDQRGCVGKSFHKHENDGVDCEDIAKWKQALREIAEREGCELPNTNNGHQDEHINTVVSYILQLLKENDLVVIGSLVGIEPHVREVMRKLGVIYVNEEAMEVCDKDVRVLGICGIPGIAKTTVAKVVYSKIRHLFQGCSFLSNIRENVESSGLLGLQIQLISDLQKQESRRLITCDEVAKVIENSFSNKKVLIVLDDVYDIDQIKHLVGNLDWFGPGSRILMVVERIDVLADMYEDRKMGPYQALQLFCKHGYPREEEDECDSLSGDIIDTIGELPLTVEVTAPYLHHNKREIKIWQGKSENKVQEAIKSLTFDEGPSECFRWERFGHLRHWRFLRFDQAPIGGTSQKVLSNLRWLHWQGCSKISELLIFHLDNLTILNLSYSLVTGDSQEWEQILEKAKELKVLILSGCPHLHATPEFHTSMSLERLVLECCPLLCQISRSIGNLKNLVSLNLKFCRLVEHLPEELCYMTALEELLIDGTSIRIIHFRKASMERLKILSACQCERLVRISNSIGQLKSLLYFGLDGAAIDSLPDSIGSLKKLQKLLLGNCWKLSKLPYSIGNLESLEVLHLSSTMIARLPRSIKDLKNLKVLKMENTHLREFPKDIEDLEMLEEIDLSQCKNLKGPIRCDFKGLSSLKNLRLSSTKTSGLPWSDDRFSDRQTLKLLPRLQQLDLSECDQVRALPILPSSLISLCWGSKKMRTVPDLSHLTNLKELYLGDSTDPEPKSFFEPLQIGWVTSLVNLEVLELCLLKITMLPENFSALKLRKLVLHYANLLDLRELPSSLSTLCLQYCTIRVPEFSKLRGLSVLELKQCDLTKIDGLDDLKLLQLLHISHCSLQTLDGLESMPCLRKLTLLDCPSLTELPDPTKYQFEINMCNP